MCPRGALFYGNYNSRKGKDIEINNNVCLNFHWPVLWHQIRINGKAEKILSSEASDPTSATLPHRLSQIGLGPSHQSEVVPEIAIGSPAESKNTKNNSIAQIYSTPSALKRVGESSPLKLNSGFGLNGSPSRTLHLPTQRQYLENLPTRAL